MFLHIFFVSQAGKGVLRQKGSQGCFAKSVCSSCFSTSSSSWYQQLGGMPRVKTGPMDNPLPNHLHEGIWEGNWSNFFLEKFVSSLSSHAAFPSPSAGSLSSPLPACHDAADSSCQDGRPHALGLVLPPACPGSLHDKLSPSPKEQSKSGPCELMVGKGRAQTWPLLKGTREGGWGRTTSWGQAKGCSSSSAARDPFPTQTAHAQLPLALPCFSNFRLTPVSTDFPACSASSNFWACLLDCLLACFTKMATRSSPHPPCFRPGDGCCKPSHHSYIHCTCNLAH